MSPKRHREVNAKVEGRDLPEKEMGTMETFRALTKRLLRVKPEELAVEQAAFETAKFDRVGDISESKKAKRRLRSFAHAQEQFNQPDKNHN